MKDCKELNINKTLFYPPGLWSKLLDLTRKEGKSCTVCHQYHAQIWATFWI